MAKPLGGLALLIGSPKKGIGKGKPMPADPGEPDADDEGDDMGGGAEQRAIQEFFEKGQARDFKGATDAFHRAWEACYVRHDEGDYGDEE